MDKAFDAPLLNMKYAYNSLIETSELYIVNTPCVLHVLYNSFQCCSSVFSFFLFLHKLIYEIYVYCFFIIFYYDITRFSSIKNTVSYCIVYSG